MEEKDKSITTEKVVNAKETVSDAKSGFATEIFIAKDGKEISLHIWSDCENPKGIVQIAHGMSEHLLRYTKFATFLNKNGYIVAGDDHRGHGETDKNNLGLTLDGDIFSNTVSDLKGISDLLTARYKLPLFLLGHSYGSFLSQSYLSRFYGHDLAGIIIMGSAMNSNTELKFGRLISKRKLKKGKGDFAGKLFARMTFESYDKKFSEGINCWLTRDSRIVGRYNTDPLCNFICSNGFYYYFFDALLKLNADTYSNSNKNIPMLLVSGEDDKLNKNTKLVRKLFTKFEKLGFSPKLTLFNSARHEILNEINKKDVYKECLDFFDSNVEKK